MGILDFTQIKNRDDFNRFALELFRYQAEANPVYSEYCRLIRVRPNQVKTTEQIPYLPIRFFKTHRVLCDGKKAEKIFRSSGTTGSTPSEHHVVSLQDYEKSFLHTFRQFYGEPSDYCIMGLLPTYADRGDASLAYMVSRLIALSGHPGSGFYLDQPARLRALLDALSDKGERVLLIGVTFALLDLAETFPGPLKHVTIMETGGMKGKRPEMIREEVHRRLKEAFGVPDIHSEYGMTELLSQAYSKGDGIFHSPAWLRMHTREIEDPLSTTPPGKTGGINITDLANTHSCAFIATQDLGKVYEDGSFSIMGRFDHADVRGCNLMIA